MAICFETILCYCWFDCTVGVGEVCRDVANWEGFYMVANVFTYCHTWYTRTRWLACRNGCSFQRWRQRKKTVDFFWKHQTNWQCLLICEQIQTARARAGHTCHHWHGHTSLCLRFKTWNIKRCFIINIHHYPFWCCFSCRTRASGAELREVRAQPQVLVDAARWQAVAQWGGADGAGHNDTGELYLEAPEFVEQFLERQERLHEAGRVLLLWQKRPHEKELLQVFEQTKSTQPHRCCLWQRPNPTKKLIDGQISVLSCNKLNEICSVANSLIGVPTTID